mmetsp:Transcript_81496/g.209863  ORF Transcript_81496/g.209863 Transcript_81496/m.209863 type:complete len:219 (+) Transcript_81496:2250-2906(+)
MRGDRVHHVLRDQECLGDPDHLRVQDPHALPQLVLVLEPHRPARALGVLQRRGALLPKQREGLLGPAVLRRASRGGPGQPCRRADAGPDAYSDGRHAGRRFAARQQPKLRAAADRAWQGSRDLSGAGQPGPGRGAGLRRGSQRGHDPELLELDRALHGHLRVRIAGGWAVPGRGRSGTPPGLLWGQRGRPLHRAAGHHVPPASPRHLRVPHRRDPARR